MAADLSFAWWNTSLSPTSRLKDKSSEEKMSVAISMLEILIYGFGADFIALCEVSSKDIEKIEKTCNLSGFSVHYATEKAGLSAFDFCIICRHDKIEITSRKSILSIEDTRITRIAQHITASISNEVEPLHVFISHWPSRLQVQQHEPKRNLYGIRLRDAVENVRIENPDASIILIGDYNDEPFDSPITEHLRATRDKELAVKKGHLFYNPFWRHLSSFTRPDEHESYLDFGSYFHGSGERTKWRTFDQMMFSSSLVSGMTWTLDEKSTRIINVPEYTKIIHEGQMKFDHLPIFSKIIKEVI